jgi:alkylation response protein AidB-like acyl-CoA dehydrogenase
MQERGTLAATVPAQFGGLGVESILDFVVGIERLARADASTAFAASLHLNYPWALAYSWRRALAEGDEESAGLYGLALTGLGTGEAIVCGAGTEPGTHMLYPMAEAVRADGGWAVSGRKSFVTLSPIATMFNIFCRYRADDGTYRRATALVQRETPGLTVKDNWDALGMRASGSHDVMLESCFVPDALFTDAGPWGEWTSVAIASGSAGNAAFVAVSLGIAEAARGHVVELARKRRRAPSNRTLAERPSTQSAVAQIEIDLAACRALLERTSTGWDRYVSEHLEVEPDPEALHVLMKELQCTKAFVNRKAIEIVDLAMTVSGGAGYLSSSPLSRMYRDARAGPFMQPFSPNEAFEYIGKVALGLDPTVDL